MLRIILLIHITFLSPVITRAAMAAVAEHTADTSSEDQEIHTSMNVPERIKDAVQEKAAKLGRLKIGVGFFRHFYIAPEGKAGGGSDLDYAEQVLNGIVNSGLFQDKNVDIANDPQGGEWDYYVGAESLAYAAKGGIKFFIKKAGESAPLFDSVSLPEVWDKDPAGRKAVMTQFGIYLAYKIAQFALKIQ